jgi:hypothetical protein
MVDSCPPKILERLLIWEGIIARNQSELRSMVLMESIYWLMLLE